MKRILMSQDAHNISNNYLLVDGVLMEEEDVDRAVFVKEILDTDNWKKLYKCDELVVLYNHNKICFQSHYKDLDIVGRKIFYIYMMENKDNLDEILFFLEQDSRSLNRAIDKVILRNVIRNIKKKKKIMSIVKISTFVLAVFLGYKILQKY